MDVDRERQLLAIMKGAFEQPPSERSRYVSAACAGDRRLADEALELLRAESDLGVFLEEPAVEPAEETVDFDAAATVAGTRDQPAPLPRLTRIGPYKLIEPLGEGGMGQVFLAEQEEPVKRRVALKLMRSSLRNKEAYARFLAERQALARLNHPNVAQLYDAGTTEDGRPFFAMELVDGRPITDFCDDHELGVEERLKIFVSVCEGVQHAHQKQLIHRDLKPSNVLVVEREGRPLVKVIDFGIAKALDRPLTQATLATGYGLLGTPAYMSPEMIHTAASRAAPDTRADVYSLGILLYELLTGVRPHEEGDPSFAEILRRITTEEPARPSSRLSGLAEVEGRRIARRRTADHAELSRRLTADLDWIVMKALARDPAERYASVAELARDVERHLEDEPVEAGPPSRRYVFGKFVRRHRMTVGAVALILALLLGAVTATSLALRRADAEARRAGAARTEAENVTAFLVELFRDSNPWAAGDPALTAREMLARGAERLGHSLEEEPLVRARLLQTIADIQLELGLAQEAEPHFELALELREHELGDDHLLVAQTLDLLGNCYYRQGKHDRAEALHLRSLEIAEARGPAGDDRRARSLFHLANAVSEQGRYPEAEELYRRSLDALDSIDGPDGDLRRARVRENLAILYIDQGRYAEAEAGLAAVLEAKVAHHGEQHPQVSRTLNNLAWALISLRRFEEAEPLVMRALNIHTHAFGPDSVNVARTLGTLGHVYTELGRFDEAERVLERSLQIRTAAHGSEGPQVSAAYQELGLLEKKRGNLAEAEAHLRRSIAIDSRAHGSDHPWVADTLFHLAGILAGSGRKQEAREAYERSLAIFESAMGPDAPSVAEVRVAYQEFLRESGSDLPDSPIPR